MIKVGILTSSDKGYAGERIDESGKLIAERAGEIPGEVIEYVIVPDEIEEIKYNLIQMSDVAKVDLILTTGGTGFSPRDITPEATLSVIDKIAPGIPEAMRAKSLEITNRAMLSRAVAGIRKKTLIINMPGSKKAVDECLDVIIPVLSHAIEILRGEGGECGRG
ncbi:MogA/MoaB family molybdenum cofactor biosynthesis protein [Alkalibacter saccharofermentans]|uniref:Molybdenum cofactor synthesis domain-containing protein n=1 Tax=Alkalibacter saccharofermentans DSM 14828 TaxID=1120975 RepID=A0A1M4TN14_9FIRM|nr:MogA/MoaB family molybdenum cofactor biosynthesis protein [Alkalibacter saccharofermentans]SHE45889.1 molybdenum cofactor synthesis domain-containing protein [Alkalibacter saccharofermentans DSM 14828]